MRIRKLNKEDFNDRFLQSDMDELDFKYLEHFTKKKLDIDYVSFQDFADPFIYNLYGKSFGEYIDYIEKNPEQIKSRFLNCRILAQIDRIENRVHHSLRMARKLKVGEIGGFIIADRKPITFNGKAYSRRLPKDFSSLYNLYTELQNVVCVAEKLFEATKESL
jgi:hypothetical protein